MKYAEIKKIFSKKVAIILSQGWVVHADAMGGSQGEIAKIAFERKSPITGNMEYAVLYLDKKYRDLRNYVRLVWARAADDYQPGWTLWLSHARPIFTQEWLEMNCVDWYMDEKEQAEWAKIRNDRKVARRKADQASGQFGVRTVAPNDPLLDKVYHLAKKHMRGGWKLRRKNCDRALIGHGNSSTYKITLWHDNTMHVFYVGKRAA